MAALLSTPSEVFVAGRMTSVSRVVDEGNGNILATFCEVPAVARQKVEALVKSLEAEDVRGVIKLGKTGEPVYEIGVAPGRVGMILLDGLNPVAAAVEAGLDVVNRTMSGLIEFGKFKSYWDLSTVKEP